MLTYEEIKGYMDPKTRFTKEVKEAITDTARAYGVAIPNCKCRNKWYDTLMLIYKAMKVREARTENGKPKMNEHYQFLRPNAVVIRGKRFDAYSHDDDIKWLMVREPMLFPKFYRVKK